MSKSLDEREQDFSQLFSSIWGRVKKQLKDEYPETPEYFWSIPDRFVYKAVSDYCTTYPEDEIRWGR